MVDRDEAVERAELLLSLRKRGIRDRMVMSAFEKVPRERFVEPAFRPFAWNDQALPIDCGQTISQPAVIALITDALELRPDHIVLEVGTGSGYHAAILGHIVKKVVTVERFHTLASTAAARLRQLGLSNVEVLVADGTFGCPPRAPFDRIVVNAAVIEVPTALLEQLSATGILIAPVGPPEETQRLMRYAKTSDGVVQRDLGPVRFVPLLPGVATVL